MSRKDSTPSASVRPQAFSASRRFAPRSGLRACFVPQPCPGSLRFRGLLSPCSSALSSTARCPLAFRLEQAHRLPGCHSLEPPLRGFAPHEAALHQQSGEPRQCPLPSRFLAPPGAPSRAGRTVLLGPLHSWRSSSRVPRPVCSMRAPTASSPSRARHSVSRAPTCSSFSAPRFHALSSLSSARPPCACVWIRQIGRAHV